jgi:hypothetical protein
MLHIPKAPLAVAAAAFVWACGGGEPASDEARDLSLAPAESLTVLDDQPPAQAPQQQTAPSRPAPTRRTEPRPVQPQSPPPKPVAQATAPMQLPNGTSIDMVSTDTITNDTHKVGDRITATGTAVVQNPDGRVVIPAGAVFTGTITEMDPGQGKLVLAFNRVSFGGQTYAMDAQSDTVAAEKKGDQFKAGDAAKVGAGAVVGAVAGKLIGKNTKGAIIGGAAGAAAGAGVAVATKGSDLVLPAGGLIRIVLTSPMVLEPLAT